MTGSTRAVLGCLVSLLLVVAACTDDPGPGRSEPDVSVSKPPENIELSLTEWFRRACALPKDQLRRIERGYFPGRSPDVMYVPKARNYFNGFAHSGPWEHVQEVPLVLYGPGYIRPSGVVDAGREVTVADLVPTFAELLDHDLEHEVDGSVLEEALLAPEERTEPPRLIVTVVWDGAGANVLGRWPGEWPTLDRLSEEGAWFAGATVGSSPSVTPPVHATIGTGIFPARHGIVDIPQREGDVIEDSWEGTSPAKLEEPSLADVYDLALDNEPLIGMFAERAWQLGMIGHGADTPGGDRDIAVLTDSESPGSLTTNEDLYELPDGLEDPAAFEAAVRAVDAEDGALDETWMDHPILDDPTQLPWTPAWTIYQSGVIEELLTTEGFGADDIPDLFFVNFKQTDHVGHRWTFAAPEMEGALEHQDAALADLVALLDDKVGRDRYVLALTADHGAQPPPEDTGGWMIDQAPLTEAIERNLGGEPGEVIEQDRPVGFWLRKELGGDADALAERAAAFLTTYTVADDADPDEVIPTHIDPDERLFDAAFPMSALDEIVDCAGA